MHRLSSYFKILLLSSLFILLSACSDSTPDRVITSFSNDLESTSMDVNRTITMKVFAHYSDGTISDVTSSMIWKSSDTSIATVSQGIVTSTQNLGTTFISYETVEKTTMGEPFFKGGETISVEHLVLTGISVSPSSVSIYEGATSDIVATGTFVNPTTSEVSQQNITDDCLWSSADSAVATVSEGVVSAISEGNTTVTASDSNISASVSVEVKRIHITKIEIVAPTKEFNAEQTITLTVEATLDTGETVVLNNSDLKYESSDTSIVTMDQNIATAVASGSAIITASLLANSSFSDTIILTVVKENYVRLFKGDVELELPYSESEVYQVIPDTLDTFTLRAVGEDTLVSNVTVKDFDGNTLSTTVASFDNLQSGDTLYKNEDYVFTLVHNGTQKQLEFSFDVGTTEVSSFTQRYEGLD